MTPHSVFVELHDKERKDIPMNPQILWHLLGNLGIMS
ncbi:hypothetical protein SAMN00768000_2524 [Sulfobacillus thermosulfidooxidans DSM 9293]|uniref:Uncharacterized protein n=1 Tax=Sulfobacillus thermosulfidooxidans (strain DSM 9293 / VKM B-1269 / AT-1) TaxID=929705 RepID=A0A1W1WI29_SULTA|nr:hypothetical protein SAMN00768000_2524 [Sulfobacillus thermosulfidooxidans DSM 9293]